LDGRKPTEYPRSTYNCHPLGGLARLEKGGRERKRGGGRVNVIEGKREGGV